jgi:UDP-N-acetylmuramoyl-L-alanyl-D-glutamate--2,6-diaminopimelate ligase
MKLDYLKEWIPVTQWNPRVDWEREMGNITGDSRQVLSGDVFVAIKGETVDGHIFIERIMDREPAAVIIQDPAYAAEHVPWILTRNTRAALAALVQGRWAFPANALGMIGVTGTNGKTTITYLIEAVLKEAGHQSGVIGTIHNRLGDEIFSEGMTTPDPADLAMLLKTMRDRGADYCVMEVSSHALSQYRVQGIEFDIVIFTNLTQDHLDYHGTMELYLAAKGKLFADMNPQGAKNRPKCAILNMDDAAWQYLADLSRVPVITYGMGPDCDVRAEAVQSDMNGIQYNLVYAHRVYPVKMRLYGRFNVYNSLAAIAAGLTENIPIEVILKALERVQGAPGRLERVESDHAFTVFVDYAHTPDGLEKCIKAVKEFCKGRVITVFGCGGNRDRGKRPKMGECAARLSDLCVITSDNPRREDPMDIIREILAGISAEGWREMCLIEPDRKQAIFKAIQMAEPGDVVLVCGKGHEKVQILGDTKIDFDDYKVARQILMSPDEC